VKLKIGTTEATAASLIITSATFETNYAGVLTVLNGSLSPNATPAAQAFSLAGTHSVSSDATGAVSSDYRLVYAGEKTSVKVKLSGTITGTLGTATFNNLTPTFTGALVPGNSYVLRVRIGKGLAWAGSNVYWEENLFPDRPEGQRGGLTFVPHGDRTREMYQGVFFRFGSLVGIDPSQYNGSIHWSPSGNAFYVPHYDPDDEQSSWWEEEDDVSKKDWTDSNPPTLNTPIPSSYYGDNIDYFASYSDYENQLGDICRYLSATGAAPAGYRMPTASELLMGDNSISDLSPYVGVSFGHWSSSGTIGKWTRIGNLTTDPGASTNPAGTYVVSDGAEYDGYVRFPAAGIRVYQNYTNSSGERPSDGRLEDVGTWGYYQSSSIQDNDGGDVPAPWAGGEMQFGKSVIYRIFVGGSDPTQGYSVRCLLDP
jgi:hypothetical protein